MQPSRLMLVITLLALVSLAPSGSAEIPDLTWEAADVVDSPVENVSSSSGSSVLFWEDVWHVVYEKSGEIYHRSRNSSEWSTPVRVSEDGAVARNPHIAGTEEHLHVVWEDARGGHPEVYTRRFTGSYWYPEECVTCDGVASRRPDVAGDYDIAVLVWEDSTASGFSAKGSFFEHGIWMPPDDLSTDSADSREPSVAMTPDFLGWIFAAWADYRHGEPEIYMTESYGDGWFGERRVTDMTEACRRPSAHSEICCGDALGESPCIAFEATAPSGVTETWAAVGNWGDLWVERLSADDGVESVRPNAGGFGFLVTECGMGGTMSRYFITWTDVTSPGTSDHQLAFMPFYPPGDQEPLPGVGLAHSAVGAVAGNPDAAVMVLWIEDRSGAPTLMSRIGSLPGCFLTEMEAPASLIITPDGTPANQIRMIDSCTGNPLEGIYIQLQFDNALDQDITWDPLQEHPVIEVQTNEDGYAVFPIRGGGCSQAGSVTAHCNWLPEYQWHGVKSPDVDGDCRVTFEDLIYFTMMMGTDDFCADLDGSGLVDLVDLHIAQAAGGTSCSDVETINEPVHPAGAFGLTVIPNPANDKTVLRVDLPVSSTVDLRVIDAAGREIRRFEAKTYPAGLTMIPWDIEDSSSRLVSSGVYFAILRADEKTVRRPILIMR